MKRFSKSSVIRLSMFTLVLCTPVNAMMKHRFGSLTDIAVVPKPSSRNYAGGLEKENRSKLLMRLKSLEERLQLVESQVSSTLAEEQKIISSSKSDLNLAEKQEIISASKSDLNFEFEESLRQLNQSVLALESLQVSLPAEMERASPAQTPGKNVRFELGENLQQENQDTLGLECLQTSLNPAEGQPTSPVLKPKKNIFSTLKRSLSLKKRKEETLQKPSSPTTPTPPISPTLSESLLPSLPPKTKPAAAIIPRPPKLPAVTSPAVAPPPPPPISPILSESPPPSLPPKTKPVAAIIPLPPKLPAATPSAVAPPPPPPPPPLPPLQDSLLLSHAVGQPSNPKNFMEELQHKKLKPVEKEESCLSPRIDVQEELMKEMKEKKLKQVKEKYVTQAPAVSPQLSELEQMFAKKRLVK